MTRVSVVLPAHDVAPWIAEAVASALGQSLSDLEVIAVDDGSRDGTGQILDDLRERDASGRLQVIHQANRGSAAARNAALARARGHFVAFLDADDRWHPENLARKVGALEADPGADLCLSGYRTIDAQGRQTGCFQPESVALGLGDLLLENPIGCGSVVVARRSAIEAAGGFDETLSACIDFDLWLRIAARRPAALRYLPQPLVDYRRRPGQITGNWREMERARDRVLEKVRALAPAELAAVERRSRDRYRLYLADLARRAEDWRGLRRLVARSWRTPSVVIRHPYGWRLSASALASLLPPHWHRALLSSLRQRRRRRSAADTAPTLDAAVDPPAPCGSRCSRPSFPRSPRPSS